MIVAFSNIDWDTDGQANADLPKEVNMEVDDNIDIGFQGADVLSDKYGYCVFGFHYEIIDEKGT